MIMFTKVMWVVFNRSCDHDQQIIHGGRHEATHACTKKMQVPANVTGVFLLIFLMRKKA